MGAIRKATAAAEAPTDKPTLIRFKAIVGYGPPNAADSHGAHGLPIFVQYTCCIMGDGCRLEGISHESCAYSRHFGRGKLCVWGDNGITIDSLNVLTISEDVAGRYEAFSWQVLTGQDSI